MNDKKIVEDVKKFVEYFTDVDDFVKKLEEGKLPISEIFKDIPLTVETMLISAFLFDDFYKVLIEETSKEDVETIRVIVGKLEKYGTKIVKESIRPMAKIADKKRRKLESEVTSTSTKPFYDFVNKQNQIRLVFFSDEDKLMDSTMSLEKCLGLNIGLLSGVERAFELASEYNSNLLPKGDDIKPYKERLKNIVDLANKIASRLKIQLETAKLEEKTEKAS